MELSMQPSLDHLLCLICLRVLADTSRSCHWLSPTQQVGLHARFRILGISQEALRISWETLARQGMIDQQNTQLRLTPLGYLQNQMPYLSEQGPHSWYEHVVRHLYTATPSERQVTV